MNTTILSLDKSPEPRPDRFPQSRTTVLQRGCDRASISENTSLREGSSRQLRAGSLVFWRKGVLLFFPVLLLTSQATTGVSLAAVADEERLARSRLEMVEKDLRARGIKDERVLQAMSTIPRHRFVDERLRSLAYSDGPQPIGAGQTISQPYVVALMTELLHLTGNEKVLEIGTGSGYQAAVLSQVAREVYTVEIIPELAQRAQETLARLGYSNVRVRVGDGFFGWEEKGPFDAVLVTAAADKTPPHLWTQLREGGRLVMPLGN